MNEWWLLGLLAGLAGIACCFMIYPFKRRFIASLLLFPAIFLLAFGVFLLGKF